MENKIEYSTPIDWDINDSWDILVLKANKHNQKIINSYSDRINEIDKVINTYIKDVFDYSKSKEEYSLLLRQLTQTRAIYITIISQSVDKGCVINGENNYVIQEVFDRMINYLERKLSVLDEYIKVVEQQVNKTTRIVDEHQAIDSSINEGPTFSV